uniref:T-cell surface glycoprotein CD3 delta chain n=1 Tax=Saimiri boliviensis boliviensis TaxID=39432 RepID=A0A2K6TDL9_SAIBB
MERSMFLSGLVLVTLLPQVSPFKIPVEELEDRVFVNCNTSITWVEGTVGTLLAKNTSLDLGKGILDPRGMYQCTGTEKYAGKVSTVQVYYRMADTQALLKNDQVYQPLRDRDDAQYSRLGGNWPRNK